MVNVLNCRVLLVDNGSLEPKSTFQLRELAAALERRIGQVVVPTSLAHSSKILPWDLGGVPAELFEAAVDRALDDGVNALAVVPLFIGPSHAVVRVLPAVLADRKTRRPELQYAIAETLFVSGDTRVAEILAQHVRGEIRAGECPLVAVVDHGSPNRAVTDVRNMVAAQVRELLGDSVAAVQPCSMERREGAEYDFNEPQLAAVMRAADHETRSTIVAMMFIAAGRHAGPGGDVAQICAAATSGSTSVRMTKLLGQHPLLIEILAERAIEALKKLQ